MKAKGDLIYFDNAASSLRIPYIKHLSERAKAGNAGDLLRRAEGRISSLLNLDEGMSVSFVPNATYGINEVAYSYTETGSLTRPSKIRRQIYLSDSEHASNHLIWLKLADRPIVYLSLEKFSEWVLPEEPSIFSFACTTNLEGIRVSIEEINKKFRGTDHVCIVDASQMMQHEIPDMRNSPIDHLIFTAHKFFGPNGVGVVCSRGGSSVGISGSNHHLRGSNYGMDFDSLDAWIDSMDSIEELFSSGFAERQQTKLRRYFIENFPRENKYVRLINGNTTSLIFLLEVTDGDISAHDYAFYLERNGVVVRAGMSCSWISGRRFDGQKIIRISLGIFNGVHELKRLFRLIKNFSVADCL